MSKFSVGDVVRVKTGSPLMTVESVHERVVACVWFVDEQGPNRGRFDEAVLRIHQAMEES